MAPTAEQSQKTVLITGCSDGGLGAALTMAFHNAGYRVFATSRNPSKMKSLATQGIEILPLDVLSPSSITSCISQITTLTGGTLNILVNNAGAQYNVPVSDLDIAIGKEIFELNVWAPIAVIQAFMPLLLASPNGAVIVNHTSVGSIAGMPFQAAYNASKAALAMFSDIMRLELTGFGIQVVELKTGGVRSKILDNLRMGELPRDSIYDGARKEVEGILRGEKLRGEEERFIDADVWARQVVGDLMGEYPPRQIWRGGSAWLVWISTFLPGRWFEGTLMKITGLDDVTRRIRAGRRE